VIKQRDARTAHTLSSLNLEQISLRLELLRERVVRSKAARQGHGIQRRPSLKLVPIERLSQRLLLRKVSK
jgi:hypothetical protein